MIVCPNPAPLDTLVDAESQSVQDERYAAPEMNISRKLLPEVTASEEVRTASPKRPPRLDDPMAGAWRFHLARQAAWLFKEHFHLTSYHSILRRALLPSDKRLQTLQPVGFHVFVDLIALGRARDLERTVAELEQRHGTPPTPEEIAYLHGTSGRMQAFGAMLLSESISRLFTEVLSGTVIMQLALFISGIAAFYVWFMGDDLPLER